MVVLLLLVLGASLAQAERNTRAATARNWTINVFMFGILVWLVKLRCETTPPTDPAPWGVTLPRLPQYRGGKKIFWKMVDGFSRKFRGMDLFAVQNAV